MTTTPRKRAPARKRPAKKAAPPPLAVDSHDQAEQHRKAAVSDALHQIVGGPLPYRPHLPDCPDNCGNLRHHIYIPDLEYAHAILVRSMMQCYRMTNPRSPEGTP